MNPRMMNLRQTRTSTQAEAEQVTEEAEAQAEVAKEEDMATTSEDPITIIDTVDTETTARRFYLSSWTYPKNLLQAVKGITRDMEEAQWTEWAMYCAPWTHLQTSHH